MITKWMWGGHNLGTKRHILFRESRVKFVIYAKFHFLDLIFVSNVVASRLNLYRAFPHPLQYNNQVCCKMTPPFGEFLFAKLSCSYVLANWGTSQARRRQLRASSGGSSDATSKASFPLQNTEARQHQGNLDVTSDVVLSCCCCPSAGANKCWHAQEPNRNQKPEPLKPLV